ncbi:MAG: hypothetical protein JXR39_05280 [Marinilabiliaceae bacterium]|nr:hypothetical protein [Marinilabiliaceae bacterium]
MNTVLNSPVVKIDYDHSRKQLVQTWTGFASSGQFREAIDATLHFSQSNPVRTIISDTLNQSVVDPADTQYAASAMPKLFQQGLKAMAFVMPKNVITQLSLKQFAEGKRSDNIKYFPSIIEARKWLESFN